jgi:hypothetical protein
VSEPTCTVNAAVFQSHQLTKKPQWQKFQDSQRLALGQRRARQPKTATGTEFVLFFQDAPCAVYSVGILANGSLSGHNLITMLAKD